MIPHTHIEFNDAHTEAWVVGDEWFWGAWHVRDRPCDTCDGDGEFFNDLSDSMTDCPDCDGIGRHTFTIDVGPYDIREPHVTVYNAVTTHRVSVVPDMVLPILTVGVEGYPHDPPEQFAWITKNGVLRVVNCVEKSDTHCGQAPSAATKGMWAVKVAVSRDSAAS
jgi:hypothetical protein